MPTKYVRKNNGYRNKPHAGAKKAPTGTDADINLSLMSPLFHDEDAAREFLEARLWPNGPVCPHCGCCDAPYKLTPKAGSKSPVRPGVYKCRACRKQFTVRVGTIFEDSHIPLCKWLAALHLMTSSKKGISSLQISRELGITPKSAWFLTHRIREAMREDGKGPFTGTIEADETYVGGKPRKGSANYKKFTGRGTPKAPVFALVQRDGKVIAMPVEHFDKETLHAAIKANVDLSASKLVTDEFRTYTTIGREFAGGHSRVLHKASKYVNAEGEHTNTIESFFGLIKRGHYGTFHKMSKKHLHRYVNEFAFRWDRRKMTDGERMVDAIKGADGKRLMYRQPSA
jgi:transposase-like protein